MGKLREAGFVLQGQLPNKSENVCTTLEVVQPEASDQPHGGLGELAKNCGHRHSAKVTQETVRQRPGDWGWHGRLLHPFCAMEPFEFGSVCINHPA